MRKYENCDAPPLGRTSLEVSESLFVILNTIQAVTMKAVFVLTLAVLVLVSCVHCEEKANEVKAEEKKPVEKVVWPGLYTWQRFVEWAQNEIAVVPDFHKRILFSDEAHFWLNGYVNKQNCRIWSEANPQVCVETPLHPEKLTVWCALWAGGILLQKR
ncbi:uncharacterized protein TNCV_2679421 [Trichonephila clavipes]|nr:uncharacterized protein TNCV_2679421 [Trichonephila clavipes]